jgi:hypothetical protein
MITWPIYSSKGKLLKVGRIDGVSFNVIEKRCLREAAVYTKKIMKLRPELFFKELR